MKKIVTILSASLLFITVNAQQLELKDITNRKYAQSTIEPITSSHDGESYYQSNKDNNMIIKYDFKSGSPIDTLFNAKTARECTFDTFDGFIISPDEKRILIYTDSEPIYRHSFKANYHYFDTRRNMVSKLTQNKNKQSAATFSKDGRMAAFVIDNDLWLAKFDFETESQITKNGEYGKIINGIPDWVYEEEFGITSLIDFSADGKLLAFVTFDESEVPEFTMQKYNGNLYPELVSIKYPKAGEVNSKVVCNVFDIESKTTRKMDLPMNQIEYIPRIEFLPSGDDLAIMTLNRDQNQFNLYFANARSTVPRLILNEKDNAYIASELIDSFHFLDDQFIYLSEKDGYSHIYLCGNTGVQQKQLTSGNYDVIEILAVDPVSKTVYYQSAEDSPLQRSINKVDMSKGNKKTLSSKKGYNNATFSSNGKYFINQYSNVSTPAIFTVNDASGKELRILEDNKDLVKELSQITLPTKELTTIKGADGQDLNAYILKPANFDSSRKYPLVMIQYSGPNSQQVLDRYSLDWENYLVSQGFIVACVDGRGTGARGSAFRKSTYMKLGIQESDDQIAAAKYLASLPYIDANKIGIWGWSYGGYNVLMSMSRGNGIFKSGVAIAPVTDWEFYDTVYTERFMKTPQQNPQGYKNASPIQLADQLQGNLLIIHGSADDNVHTQNTMEYVDALIQADKPVDMFIFTDKDHSIQGADNRTYLYNKVVNHFKKNM